MDSQAQDQQQPKDFIQPFFPIDGSIDSQMPISIYPFQGTSNASMQPQQGMPSISLPAGAQFNMDMLGNLMPLQGMESGQSSGGVTPQTPSYNPQLLLEQQFKLNQLKQLQQLQNQIFQQQIAIISGQSNAVAVESSADTPRDRNNHFHGLPTPSSSSELRPQQNSEFVSPMSLHYLDSVSQEQYRNSAVEDMTAQLTQYPPRGSASAPAHIAFRTTSSLAGSASDVDFDISPLTSPWLGANQQSISGAPLPTSNKRTASPSGDEVSRKRMSPAAVRPTNPSAPPSKKPYARGSRSTNSTPLLRSSRTRKGSSSGDTPSPVDLSMPPPAPPVASTSSSSSISVPPSPASSSQFTPVTPASIMKLGRLGIDSSLTPPGRKDDPKGRQPVAESSRKGARKPITGSIVSPSLKTILPAGVAPQPNMSPVSSTQPVMQVRKTSHKAAEQKRRDSLKTTFDELRGLLPPIPLPTEERGLDEPVLPGALPPRGPPKAGGEGPNKGVSKLQLLICGNDFIRTLKERVVRRDDEIDRLRREVVRLRGILGDTELYEGEELDLERDLDASEAAMVARGGSLVADDEGDDGDGD